MQYDDDAGDGVWESLANMLRVTGMTLRMEVPVDDDDLRAWETASEVPKRFIGLGLRA